MSTTHYNLSVRLKEDTYKLLSDIARQEDAPLSFVVRRAINAYLVGHTKQHTSTKSTASTHAETHNTSSGKPANIPGIDDWQ